MARLMRAFIWFVDVDTGCEDFASVHAPTEDELQSRVDEEVAWVVRAGYEFLRVESEGVARMSGTCEVCTHCGGEMRMVADDSLGFTVKLGICPNCNHGQVITPDEVTFDDEKSDQAVGLLMKYRKEQEDRHRIPVIDNNGFQMRCKTDPRDSKGYCASCSHSHAIVEDGEYDYKMECDLGHGCFKHDCEDWEPTKVWSGMGNNCRHCYNSYITEGRVPMCRIRDVPTRSVSDYVKGNCEDYEPCTDWDFEKKGYTVCPQCGGTAYVHRKGRVKCKCGYTGWED